MPSTTPSRSSLFFRRTFIRLALLFAAAGLSGCASLGAVSPAAAAAMNDAKWLPNAAGWTVREVDASETPRWVLYERHATVADVTEFRVVGLVDAPPALVVRAVRHRLVDDKYLPDGLERTFLKKTDHEIIQHGFQPLPFPFDDREVTERIRFTVDAATGTHQVDSREIDSDQPARPGALRIPIARNAYRIAAPISRSTSTATENAASISVVTIDSVHDLGGHFPNALIDGAICGALIDDLTILETVSRTLGPIP